MKKAMGIFLVLCLAVTFVLAGCNSQKQAVAGAGGEPAGKIVIYTSMYEDIIEAVDRVLERTFPRCDIEFLYGGTGALQARINAEQASGRLGCDMLLVAEPSYSLELKETGMLHTYKSPAASNLLFDYDPDGYWYPVRISNMVIAYNPEKSSRNSVPGSFYDFAYDAGLKGLVSMSNPLTSGTAMATVTALKDKYGYTYFEALAKQEVVIESGSVALERLESGECRAVMILEESVLKKREEERSKLEVIYPDDGTVMIPSTIMTIAEKWSASQNAAAAEKITDWFLGTEGQNAIVSGWMHSVRKDYPKPPFDSIPTAQIMALSMPVNWINCFKQRNEIQERFEELVIIGR